LARSSGILTRIKSVYFLESVAGGLVQPYYSFLSVINGVTGPLLGVVSSASVVIMDVVPYALRNLKSLYPSIGFIVAGIAWLGIALVSVNGVSLNLYLASLAGLGMASYAIQVLLEPLSRGRRGDVLGGVTQYSRLGSLTATLVTGFIVGSNYDLNRIFATLTGLLYLASGVQTLNIKVSEAVTRTERVDFRLVLVNSVFFYVWSLAWPLFPLLEVYKFHMNETNLAIISTIGGLSGIVGQRWANKLINTRPVLALFLGRSALAIYPLAYALSTNVYEVYLAYLAMALTSTTQPALLAVVYNRSQDVKRSLAQVYFWQGIASLLGSVTSSTAVWALTKGLNAQAMVAYVDIAMIVIATLRFVSSTLYVLLIKETRSGPSLSP